MKIPCEYFTYIPHTYYASNVFASTPIRLVNLEPSSLLSTQTHITLSLCLFLSSAMNGFVALKLYFQLPKNSLYSEDNPLYSEACQSHFEVTTIYHYHPRLMVRVELAKTLRSSSMAAHPVVLGVAVVP